MAKGFAVTRSLPASNGHWSGTHCARVWGGGKIRAVRKLEKQRAYKGAVTCMGCVLAARLQTQLARTLAVTHAAHAPRVLTKVWTAAQVG